MGKYWEIHEKRMNQQRWVENVERSERVDGGLFVAIRHPLSDLYEDICSPKRRCIRNFKQLEHYHASLCDHSESF